MVMVGPLLAGVVVVALGKRPAEEVGGEADAGIDVPAGVDAARYGARHAPLVPPAAVDGLVVQLVHERDAVRRRPRRAQRALAPVPQGCEAPRIAPWGRRV